MSTSAVCFVLLSGDVVAFFFPFWGERRVKRYTGEHISCILHAGHCSVPLEDTPSNM